jgi:transposase
MMEVLYPKCAGLDVHKDQVTACVRIVENGELTQEVRAYTTTTSGLLALAEWLAEEGCTHVAMEATGVYWKPVWHVLEGSFELLLANAQHVRNVPGRKSDVKDATWLADLLAHGLIRGSFVPPTPIQEMRGLTRTRKQLVREIAQHIQRIQKTLEDANIKLSSVISEVLGVTGRAILNALIAGETDPTKLALLARPGIRASQLELTEALRGRVTEHHRFLLKLHLTQVASLEQAVRDLEARMGDTLAPFRDKVETLKTIPGVSDVAAQVIVSEVGLDMNRFPTSAHLISWAGLCPKLDQSAGKRRSTRVRNGAPWLKTTLVTAAWAAARKKTGCSCASKGGVARRRLFSQWPPPC